jgi:hypothetical protein
VIISNTIAGEEEKVDSFTKCCWKLIQLCRTYKHVLSVLGWAMTI